MSSTMLLASLPSTAAMYVTRPKHSAYHFALESFTSPSRSIHVAM
jgi:hypothetical protein